MGERGKWVMGMEEGTCWDEHRVLYGNQFDNKFHKKKKKKKKTPQHKVLTVKRSLMRHINIPCRKFWFAKGLSAPPAC